MKNGKALQRRVRIDISSENLYKYDGLVFDSKSNEIFGHTNGEIKPLIGTATVALQRDRQYKSPKVLQQVVASPESVFLTPDHQLGSYDHVLAIDTNTRKIFGSNASVTAAVHMVVVDRTAQSLNCSIRNFVIFEFWNAPEKQENIGWCEVLKVVEQNRHEFMGSVAVLVDSDLGHLPEFNQRTLPLHADYLLPEFCTLSYASDAVGTLGGRLIKRCHTIADMVMKRADLLVCTANLQSVNDQPFTHYRPWNPDDPVFGSFLSHKN